MEVEKFLLPTRLSQQLQQLSSFPSSSVENIYPQQTIYPKLKEIGQGVEANIYVSSSPISSDINVDKVALKEFQHSNLDIFDRTLVQINIMKICDHPNIVKIFDVGINTENKYFLTMELATGSLFSLRKDIQYLSEEVRIQMFVDVVKGLQYLHHNHIFHLDLHHQNILLFPGESRPILKISDFGLANFSDRDAVLYELGFFISPPEYLESKINGQSFIATPQLDIWALGNILYELLTGEIFLEVSNSEIYFLKFLDEVPSSGLMHKWKNFHLPGIDKDSYNLKIEDLRSLLNNFLQSLQPEEREEFFAKKSPYEVREVDTLLPNNLFSGYLLKELKKNLASKELHPIVKYILEPNPLLRPSLRDILYFIKIGHQVESQDLGKIKIQPENFNFTEANEYDAEKRQMVGEWLSDAFERYSFPKDVLERSMIFMDKLMRILRVPISKIQLCAAISAHLQIKIHYHSDLGGIDIKNWVYFADNCFTVEDFLKQEVIILLALDFNIYQPLE